jgi:hypothetical protein
LSSQTGYDSSAELQYTMPKRGWLCGTTGFPLGKASGNLLYAGKYHHSPVSSQHAIEPAKANVPTCQRHCKLT